MELRDGIFAVKLCELEHQYGLLRSRLELCQGADHERVRHLLGDVLEEVREKGLLRERSAGSARSPAAAELAAAPRDYVRRVESILREKRPRLLRDQAEAAALFAEYAIDFAGQAVRGALAAALTAMDQEMDCEEEREEEPV